jgi:hypothetical protein
MSRYICPTCGNLVVLHRPFSPMIRITCANCQAVLGFSAASMLRCTIGAALAGFPILIVGTLSPMISGLHQWIIIGATMLLGIPLLGLGAWIALDRWGKLVVDPNYSERIDRRLDRPHRIAFWIFAGVTAVCGVGSVIGGLLWPSMRDLFTVPALMVFPVGLYGMWPLILGKRGILRNWNAEDIG